MSHECSKGDIASYTSPRLQVHAHVNGEESKLSQKSVCAGKSEKNLILSKMTEQKYVTEHVPTSATQC